MLRNDKEKNEEKSKPGEINIELMIPAEDVDLEAYNQLLDMAFEHHEANNIAVTGIHGAGKSSILKTYQKNNPGKKIIFISLANMTTVSEGDAEVITSEETKPSHEMKRKLLEDRIYKQLKYYSNKTWKTVTRGTAYWRMILGFFSYFWLLCGAYLLRFQEWSLFYGKVENNHFHLDATTKNDFFLLILFVWIFLSFVLWMVGISKIKNVSLELKGGKITWEHKDEVLLGLRERTDEIVQLIQRLNVDGIVFEDLDRYPDMIAPVIENLLDINRLVNTCDYNRMERYLQFFLNKPQKKKDRKWNIIGLCLLLLLVEIGVMFLGFRLYVISILPLFFVFCIIDCVLYSNLRKWCQHILFIYVCNNEMLRNEDTIKYFNMQIPVVPVLSRINAEKILREQLDKVLESSDSQNLSFILSGYLDNYNQIKDIVMNFYVYYHRLGEVEGELGLDKAKMFAMITYKAFFPKDFTEVQCGNDKGYLDYVFKKYTGSGNASNSGRRSRNSVLVNDLKGKTVLECRKMLTDNAPEIFDELISNSNFNMIIELIKEGLLDEAYEDYIAYIYGGNDEIRERRFIEALSKDGKAYRYKLKHPESVCDEIGDGLFSEMPILNFSILEHLLKNKNNNRCQTKLDKMLGLIINKKVIDFFCGFCSDAEDSMVRFFVNEINKIDSQFIANIPEEIMQLDIEIGVNFIIQIGEHLQDLGTDFQNELIKIILSDKYMEYVMGRIEEEDEQLLALCKEIEVEFTVLQLKGRFCRHIFENHLFCFTQEGMVDIFKEIFCYDEKSIPWEKLTETIYESNKDRKKILKEYVEKHPACYLQFIVEICKGRNIKIDAGKRATDWIIDLCNKDNSFNYTDRNTIIKEYYGLM